MGLTQPDTVVLNWLLLLPFFAALCAELFPRLALHVHDEKEVEALRRGPFLLGALTALMGFGIALSLSPQALRGAPLTVDYWWTRDLYHLRFQADALSVAMCATLWAMGLVMHLYLAGLPAMSDVHHRAALLLAAQGCVAAACLSADLVLLFFLLELAVVCLWLLVRLDHQPAANGMLAAAHVGGLVFLGGVLLAWGRAGDTSLAALPFLLLAAESASLRPMAALVLLGLLPKLAAAPGHGWLPDAARGAPATALAPALLLPLAGGATLVRLLPGAFAVGLLPSLLPLALALGLFGLWAGAVRAWLAKGLLELAAWLTVSQAGLALIALGAGAAAERSPEMTRALVLHLPAAAAGLCCLWVGASAIRVRLGTEVIHNLGDSLKTAPLAVIALLVGGHAWECRCCRATRFNDCSSRHSLGRSVYGLPWRSPGRTCCSSWLSSTRCDASSQRVAPRPGPDGSRRGCQQVSLLQLSWRLALASAHLPCLTGVKSCRAR
jgi:formate hydrogenlyase subunit 3/multisubunit Na+/H+ antiporter MnhD subunit